MIAFVIAIAVFRFFQKLAIRHQKVHWKVGFLGMSVFLLVQYICIFSFEFFTNFGFVKTDASSLLLFSFFGWIISTLVVFSLYRFLSKHWTMMDKSKIESDINDIGTKE
ncbi:hypothetical protein MQX03_13975 [Chryseobacterium aahli]|uniref:hypothetical protein n=1 Tax=Chryseobacterium aahli TaxID=1278643 RepID=UPI001F603884|nr:hypothetical protein [Chryseobacterium aahli]MCI3938307.1 hypothetical protein [Chryseobacterium aahli]